MMQRIMIVMLSILMSSVLSLGVCYADNAEVLPKGVSRVRLTPQLYFPVDEQYDDDGNVEDVAADYNTNLDSSVFSDLSLLESAFFMLPGSASLGDSVVSLEYQWYELDFFYEYGLTDRLTVGIHIPYWWNKTKVGASVDTTNATIGINPNVADPLDPFFGVPLIPVTLGGIKDDALATEVAQDGLTQLGFNRLETWSDEGFSDIEVGGRYQYLKTEDWRLAFTGALRFPTGEVDDPDNLVDFEFGEGVYALLFHFNNDYISIEDLVLNATFKYTLKLPGKETLRVPGDVDQPITDDKEKVDRDLGDIIELEASATYEFSKGLNASVLYKYGYKFEDKVSGDMGFAYESLEDETDYTEHVGIITLTYSTIPLYKEKKFSLPLETFIRYRNRFAGSNRAKSQWIGLGLAVYF